MKRNKLLKEDKKVKVNILQYITIGAIILDAITTYIIVGKNGGIEKNIILYLINHYINNLLFSIIVWVMFYVLFLFGLELILKYYKIGKYYPILLLTFLTWFLFFTLIGNIMFIIIFYIK